MQSHNLGSKVIALTLLLWSVFTLGIAGVSAQVRQQTVPAEAVGSPDALNPEAIPAADHKLYLTFALKTNNSAQASAFVNSLTDPTSPNYHQWITAQQYGAKFGASPQDITTVVNYLSSLGLSNIDVWPDRQFISAEASKVQAESAFGVQILGYGRTEDEIARGYSPTFYAPDRNPSVTETVASLLNGIFGLSNKSQRRATFSGGLTSDISSQGYLDPIDLSKAYNISALHGYGLEGQGVTVAIFSPTAYQPSDITRFLTYNGITGSHINVINVNGGNTNLSDQVEACIDIETIVGQAPGATVNVYEGPNDGSFNIFQQVEIDRPNILSESYGIDENEVDSAYASSYESLRQTMSAEGITIFVASGDNGAYDNVNQSTVTVSVDASSNYVTAVGGTELTLNNDVWTSEKAWTYRDGTTSGNSGSGGGLSIYFPRQSWQTGSSVIKPQSNGMRQVPDVAALASTPFYDISTEGSFQGWGGTSCAAPLWAGSIALIEQNLGTKLGNINPTLYSLGNNNPSVYHDITSGNNGLYSCTSGWDFVTGWGSVNFAGLLTGFGGSPVTITGFSPTSGVAGTPVTITGTNLANATSVTFGGVAATTITSDTAGQIVANVPTGAVTGPISVTTPKGTATSSTNFTVVQATFSVNANPNAVSVNEGSTGPSTISLTIVNGFSQSVTLSASGLPSGVSAAFSPGSISGSTPSTVTFTVSPTVLAGTSTITITGTSGTIVNSTTISLKVLTNPILTSITISPSTASLPLNGTQQFTAIAFDQFGNSLATQPAFSWSILSGVGTVSSTGNYSAGSTPGLGIVQAASGTIAGTATVAVADSGPTIVTAASATPNPVTGTTTNLSVLGGSSYGASNITYTWSATGTPPAPVVFSKNGTNAAQNTVATFSKAGSYNLSVKIIDLYGVSTTSSVTVTVNQTLTSIVVSPATITLVVGTTNTFTSVANDQFGNPLATQPSFTYTTTGGGTIGATTGLYTATTAGGPFKVTSSSGNISGTASVTVTPTPNFTFSDSPSSLSVKQGAVGTVTTTLISLYGFAGNVTFSATGAPTGVTLVFNPATVSGNQATTLAITVSPTAVTGTTGITVAGTSGSLRHSATVNLTVISNPILSSISVSPIAASLPINGVQQFSATGRDQFGNVLTPQPTFTWSVLSGGVGSISNVGSFSAGTIQGSATVQAASGSVTGTASVTVADTAPTVVNAASATPNPVIGTSTTLSALGASDAGAGNLTYTWATVGTPPAAVNFSVNGTNAAQNTVATFTSAGSYTFQVTIADSYGLSTTSTVNVTVNQTLSSIAVSPATATVAVGGTQTFTATAVDQFGNALAVQPTFFFTVSGGGSIGSSTGIFNATTSGGPFTVTASSGNTSGTAAVTVTGAAPSFTISALPTTVNVLQGSSGGSTISLNNIGGFSQSVALTASGLPSGVAAVFTPASISGTGTSSVSFTASPTAATGTTPVTITGTSASIVSTTTVSVTVVSNPILTSITVSPSTVSLPINGTQQFTATGFDQFGNALASQPTFTWSVLSGGVGSISNVGSFSAGTIQGSATVQAASGSVTGTASVTVADTAPTVVNAASATPNPVIGTSTTLSALGASDAGAGNLTYTWATVGTPPAAVNFSVNGTNAAQNTVATFTKAGNYTFQVTIADSYGLSISSTVNVTVNQSFSSVTVSPAAVTLPVGGTQTFAATALDQFGNALAIQPTFTYTVNGGGSIGASSGVFNASSAGGPFTVRATSAGISGTAGVTVSSTANFSFSVNPSTLSVNQGAAGTVTVTLVSLNGFNGYVTFTATGLPTGVTATFNPPSVSGSSATTLTLQVSPTAALGTTGITVTGKNGTWGHSLTVHLTVAP